MPSGGTSAQLVVKLIGTAVNGGVSMSSGQVTWGSETGTVTALEGGTIGATVNGPKGSVNLTMELNLNQSTGTLTGNVSGTSGSRHRRADNENLGTETLSTPQGDALPRLLAGPNPTDGVVDIEEHLALWGRAPVRSAGAELIDKLADSGLNGHGGAWFPWRPSGGRFAMVGSHTVVVGNGAEGEPASSKDALLLAQLPHLVLDGLSLAGAALGASQVVMYVPCRWLEEWSRRSRPAVAWGSTRSPSRW